MDTALSLAFGWISILSAAATLGALVTGILFYAAKESFGKINDIANVFQMALMLPVAAAVFFLTRPANGMRLRMLS